MSKVRLTNYQKEQLIKQYGDLLKNPLKFALKIQNVTGVEATSQHETTSAGVVAYLASRFGDLCEYMKKTGRQIPDLREIVRFAVELDRESPDDDQQHLSALMLGLSDEHKHIANEVLKEMGIVDTADK